jgi:hypothetical protein
MNSFRLRAVLSILVSVFLTGCVTHSSPKQPKATVHNLKPFEGIYANTSSASSAGQKLGTLFPDLKGSFEADSIKVTVQEKSVTLEARLKGKVLGEKTFIEGKDFHLFASQVTVSRKPYGISSPHWSGVMVPIPPVMAGGIRAGSMFLNKNGDLVYRLSTNGAGLVLYFIPIVGHGTGDVVFNRLSQ